MPLLASRTQISLRNILFATDFSSCSETALPHALALSHRYSSTLYTVSVVPPEFVDADVSPDPLYLRHSAQNKMADLVKSGRFQGIEHHELVKEEAGVVTEVLLDLIGKFDINLMVLGTHGRSGIKKLALGSVAETIVNRAPCAVLAVGPHVPAKSVSDLKLRRVLYATDLLPGSARALAHALWLAEHEQAQLILLHVLKMHSDVSLKNPEAKRDIALKQLEQLLSPDTVPSVEANFIVETGEAAERILKVADAQAADLIVIGPHHTSHVWLSAHLPWVTPHQVLWHARCPILTVRD